ncbi:hypothetical protein G6F22_015489 [Rhizopus arrhizus]|nr:hypothetical protein G6F22_015489 [Rhizopus arrhizus]
MLVQTHQVVAARSAGDQRVHWRHAEFHHVGQFHGVFAMQGERGAGVRAHRDPAARLVVHLERFAVALFHRARLFHGIGRDAVVGVGDDVAHRGDGGHQIGLGRQHFAQAVVVHEDAVLDGIDAGAHRVQDALGALRVAGRAFAKALGLVHARLHFVEAVVRIHRADAGRHDAAGRHDLHQVAAGVHLFAHRLDHVFTAVGDAADAVAVAARHADDAAGRLDGGAGEHAARDGVAHAEFQIVLAAAVAQRRDAAAQAGLRILQRGQRDLGRALLA